MIIRRRDSKDAEINELTSLLSLPLPENKRFLIDTGIINRNLAAGRIAIIAKKLFSSRKARSNI